MATIAAQRPHLLRDSSYFMKNHRNLNKPPDWMIRMNPSSQKKNREKFSSLSVPPTEKNLFPSEVQVTIRDNKIEFGGFVVREAVSHEEYWSAAWLRAETHWEDRTSDRYVDNYKRKFTEQEFNAIKRRQNAQTGQKCTCIVAVKQEYASISHTAPESTVGTLDLSIGYLQNGANFPGERVKAPLFGHINMNGARYGYISNLCVAQSARRKGIASKMLNFAISSAKMNGAEQVFVQVHSNNKVAQDLYQKLGFEVVELASSQLSSDQTHMLRFTL